MLCDCHVITYVHPQEEARHRRETQHRQHQRRQRLETRRQLRLRREILHLPPQLRLRREMLHLPLRPQLRLVVQRQHLLSPAWCVAEAVARTAYRESTMRILFGGLVLLAGVALIESMMGGCGCARHGHLLLTHWVVWVLGVTDGRVGGACAWLLRNPSVSNRASCAC